MLKKMLLPLFALLGIGACAQSDLIEIEGKVYVKGSAPHTYVVIEDSKQHKSYKVVNEKSFSLIDKQKQTVHVKARALKEAIGPGFPAEIEIISID